MSKALFSPRFAPREGVEDAPVTTNFPPYKSFCYTLLPHPGPSPSPLSLAPSFCSERVAKHAALLSVSYCPGIHRLVTFTLPLSPPKPHETSKLLTIIITFGKWDTDKFRNETIYITYLHSTASYYPFGLYALTLMLDKSVPGSRIEPRPPAQKSDTLPLDHQVPLYANTGSAPNFAWRESEKPFRKNHPHCNHPGSNPDLSIFGSLVQHENSALDYAATEAVRGRYREGIEVVSSSDHYEGGTTDFYNLSIRNSTRYDQGVYTVVLENEVGASEPNDAIYVSIYYERGFPEGKESGSSCPVTMLILLAYNAMHAVVKPTVSLTMETSTLTPTPVRELDRMNITLVCRVEQGNPDLLIGVRWYLGGELLKELPDCEGGNATSPASAASDLTFCDIDPSRLLLENVGRGFHGNYSCEGRNEAGWGPLSQDQELVVYCELPSTTLKLNSHYSSDPPGPSTLVYEPREVVKKGTVTLRCTVEEPGYPETSTFKWMRGTHHIPNVTSASLTNPVTLETESNFTCLAYNEGGEGEPATIYIDVLAPPAFIGRLPLYHGALVTAQNVSVSCRVECSPLCAVHWLKNGQHLGDTSRAGSQYRVNNTVLPPDTRSGDFESTLSTLVWNMAAWPGGRLDRIHDNDNYTCQSDDNIAGPGVRSSTIFRVECESAGGTTTTLQFE
uniref:Ig-like domain-containing protein n=1 Tax=Timema poppense TaxID=170557 RepID=A0A7R9CIX0_TIMPO|nr:unnamed protein product [Timema poppensis]